jgi:hypothetical protein
MAIYQSLKNLLEMIMLFVCDNMHIEWIVFEI